MAEKKKSFLDKAIDALTDRDEKAAAEKAAADKAAAQASASVAAAMQKAAAERAAAEKAVADKAAAEAKAVADKAAALKAATEADARRVAAADAARKLSEQQAAEAKAEKDRLAAIEAAKPKFIGEYKIQPNDTLSHVALKYYGNAARDYWMVIYEANKDVIGSNPGMVRVGTTLKIPELPASLKK